MFWKQQHAVAYIAGANDARLNGFPPNAEILDAFTMILGKTERFVGFVQLGALLAAMVAVAGIARRIGLSVRQALFGALLFATLPVVVLQSATALNDLVFGALLVCCAYFLFTWTPVSLALSALALGLALGTKFTAILALPLLAVFGAVIHPRRRWPALVLVGVGGMVLGAYWYLAQHREDAPRQRAGRGGPERDHAPAREHALGRRHDRAPHAARDRRGRPVGGGRSRSVPVPRRGRPDPGARAAGTRPGGDGAGSSSAGALAALPLAFRWVHHELLHGYQKLWLELDRREVAFLGFDKHLTRASPFQSWYGAAGLLLVLACLWLAWRGWRRGSLPLEARSRWRSLRPPGSCCSRSRPSTASLDGRYVVFAVALAAALWGLVLPIGWPGVGDHGDRRPVALALVLVHYDEKPSGVDVLGGVGADVRLGPVARAGAGARRCTAARMTRRGDAGAPRRRRARRLGSPFAREDVEVSVLRGEAGSARRVRQGPPQTFRQGPDWIVVAPGMRKPVTFWVSRRVVNSNGWRLYRVTPS